MPKLLGIFGDLRIVFAQNTGRVPPPQALHTMLPALEEVRGDVELRYTRSDTLPIDPTAYRL
jgi:hypothetical protein